MDDWVQRLKDERAELKEKYNNLALFLGSHGFMALPEVARSLLKTQYSIMEAYLIILKMRIAIAEGTAD